MQGINLGNMRHIWHTCEPCSGLTWARSLGYFNNGLRLNMGFEEAHCYQMQENTKQGKSTRRNEMKRGKINVARCIIKLSPLHFVPSCALSLNMLATI